jgi:hypothetical protein
MSDTRHAFNTLFLPWQATELCETIKQHLCYFYFLHHRVVTYSSVVVSTLKSWLYGQKACIGIPSLPSKAV